MWRHDSRRTRLELEHGHGNVSLRPSLCNDSIDLFERRRSKKGLARVGRRVAARLGVSYEEVASRSLRRPALAARAIVSHVAVCHYGLSLTAVGRCLGGMPVS